MSIVSYVTELQNIKKEIKLNNQRNKKLRVRIRELEDYISNYLEEKNQNGIKYRGEAILLQDKNCRTYTKKKEKEDNILSLLKSFGIQDTKNAYIKLEEARKGEVTTKKTIKIQKLPKQY